MSKIEKYKTKGYDIIKETKTYATFRVPKRFNWTAFIFLCIVLNIFGLMGYIIYYSIRPVMKEETVWK